MLFLDDENWKETKQRLIQAQEDFNKAEKTKSSDWHELGEKYLSILTECLNLLSEEHPGAPGFYLIPDSRTASSSIRKDAEEQTRMIREEYKRVSELLEGNTKVSTDC